MMKHYFYNLKQKLDFNTNQVEYKNLCVQKDKRNK